MKLAREAYRLLGNKEMKRLRKEKKEITEKLNESFALVFTAGYAKDRKMSEELPVQS